MQIYGPESFFIEKRNVAQLPRTWSVKTKYKLLHSAGHFHLNEQLSYEYKISIDCFQDFMVTFYVFFPTKQRANCRGIFPLQSDIMITAFSFVCITDGSELRSSTYIWLMNSFLVALTRSVTWEDVVKRKKSPEAEATTCFGLVAPYRLTCLCHWRYGEECNV